MESRRESGELRLRNSLVGERSNVTLGGASAGTRVPLILESILGSIDLRRL